MTNDDLKQLQEWQESPQGLLFESIYSIDNSLKVMEQHMRSREGLQFLRQSQEDLADLTERMQTVLYATKLQMEAAE